MLSIFNWHISFWQQAKSCLVLHATLNYFQKICLSKSTRVSNYFWRPISLKKRRNEIENFLISLHARKKSATCQQNFRDIATISKTADCKISANNRSLSNCWSQQREILFWRIVLCSQSNLSRVTMCSFASFFEKAHFTSFLKPSNWFTKNVNATKTDDKKKNQ